MRRSTGRWFRRWAGSGQDLAQVLFDPLFRVPVAGITEGYFFKAHAAAPVSAWEVQMPIDDDRNREAYVPVLGAASAAPERKAGNPPEPDQILAKRKMIDENQ